MATGNSVVTAMALAAALKTDTATNIAAINAAIDASWPLWRMTEHGMPAAYYAVDIGFCRLIVLDDNYDASGSDTSDLIGYLSESERAWLANEIATTSQDVILICTHHPPIADRWGASDIQALSDAIGTRVNVWVLSGHMHAISNVVYTVGAAVIHNLAPIVFGAYSIVTAQRMSNGLATLKISQHSTT